MIRATNKKYVILLVVRIAIRVVESLRTLQHLVTNLGSVSRATNQKYVTMSTVRVAMRVVGNPQHLSLTLGNVKSVMIKKCVTTSSARIMLRVVGTLLIAASLGSAKSARHRFHAIILRVRIVHRLMINPQHLSSTSLLLQTRQHQSITLTTILATTLATTRQYLATTRQHQSITLATTRQYLAIILQTHHHSIVLHLL